MSVNSYCHKQLRGTFERINNHISDFIRYIPIDINYLANCGFIKIPLPSYAGNSLFFSTIRTASDSHALLIFLSLLVSKLAKLATTSVLKSLSIPYLLNVFTKTFMILREYSNYITTLCIINFQHHLPYMMLEPYNHFTV